MIDKLFFPLYKTYNYRIFRHVKDRRGATFIQQKLDDATRIGIEKISDNPSSIFEKDWDNLIILDACRHDLYEEVNGETVSRISLGSTTKEYITKTFNNGDFSNVVYVTSNPHFAPHIFENLTGRKLEETFHTVSHAYMNRWNDKKNTVLPKDMVSAALDAQDKYPDKKLIIHFMQPHYPFINSSMSKNGIRPDMNHKKEESSVWDLAECGKYKRDTLWKAYKENLEITTPHVEQLAAQLQGKTVLTSDHGNLVGENGRYGHPYGSKAKVLRKVPWDVISKNKKTDTDIGGIRI